MSRTILPGILVTPLLLLAGFGHANPAAAMTPAPKAESVTVLKTRMELRDLWVEHAFWIRSYVLADHAGDDAQRKVAETEIVANASALASTIKPFYGQAAADHLLGLLGGHWTAVRDYNTAAFRQSGPDKDHAAQAIATNARGIAAFLGKANPYLPEDAVFGLLAAHGSHHMTQSSQIASGNFRSEAQNWHAMRKHMLMIADSITSALARQFPERFP